MAFQGEDYDQKILEMEFDNAEFEKNIRQSMDSLDGLQDKLDNLRGGSAFEQIAEAASNLGFDKVVYGIESIDQKLSALGIVGATVIHQLTNDFMSFGRSLWRMTMGQISSGGMRRALNIQQAEFLMEGLKLDVKQLKDDAMFAVEDTAYGFDEAASAAAQFGVAGVKAGEEMKHALLGVSGVAAMTGRDYASIAHIFTTMASSGRVMGMQLTQMSYAGINATEVLAKHLHTTSANVTKMVSQGKVSFREFSEAMYEAFGLHAKDANKTFQGNLSNIKAALSRIGAEFAGPLTTDFIPAMGELRNFINQIKTDLGPIIDLFGKGTKILSKISENFFGALKNSKVFGNVLEGIRNILVSIILIGFSIADAFRGMFPNLDGVSEAFKLLTIYLIPTEEKLQQITAITKIFVSFIVIGIKVLSAVFNIVGKVFIIAVYAIGTAVSAIVDFILASEDAQSVLEAFANGFKLVLYFVVELVKGLIDLANNETVKKFASSCVSFLSSVIEFLKKLGVQIVESLPKIVSFISGVFDTIKNSEVLTNILTGAATLFDKLSECIQNLTKNLDVLDISFFVLIGILLAALPAIIGTALKTFRKIKKYMDFIGSMTSSMNAILAIGDTIQGLLKKTELEIYAKLLLKFALSVGVLALSMKLLSTLSWPEIIKGFVAVMTLSTIMMSVLVALFAFAKEMGGGKDPKAAFSAFEWMAGLVTIMSVMGVLLGSLAVIAHFDPGALAQATATMTALILFMSVMAGLPIAIKHIDGGNALSGTTMLAFAASIVVMSVALSIMVGALAMLVNSVNTTPETLHRAENILIGLGIGLAALLGMQKFIFKADGQSALKMAGAFAIISAGVVAIALALAQIAKVGKPKSIIAAGIAVGAIALALGFVTKIMKTVDILDAASFAIMAASLVLLAGGMTVLSLVDWPSVLVAAGAITLLGFAIAGIMKIMNGQDAIDALAFTAIAVGITLIISSMAKLKDVDSSKILVAAYSTSVLVGVLVAVSAIGVEAAPVIWAVAAALVGIGLYSFAIGTGIKYVSEGLSAWVDALIKFSEVSTDLVPNIINNLKKLIVGLSEVADIIVAMAPRFVAAIVVVGKLLGVAITEAVYVILTGLLKLIIGVAAFLDEHIIEILDLFNGIFDKMADWLLDHTDDLEEIGYKLGIALGEGLGRGLMKASARSVVKHPFGNTDLWAEAAADEWNSKEHPFLDNVKTSYNIISGLTQPIDEDKTFATSLRNLALGGVSAVCSALEIHSPSRVMMRIGGYIVDGLNKGVSDSSDEFGDQIDKLVTDGTKEAEDDVKESSDKLATAVSNFNESFDKATSNTGTQAEKYAGYVDFIKTSTKDATDTIVESNETLKNDNSADAFAESQKKTADAIVSGAKATEDAADIYANSYKSANVEKAKAIVEGSELTDKAVEIAAVSETQSVVAASESTEETAFECGGNIVESTAAGIWDAIKRGDTDAALNGLFGSIESTIGKYLGDSFGISGIDAAGAWFGKSGRDYEAEGMQLLGGQYAWQRAGYESLNDYVYAAKKRESDERLNALLKRYGIDPSKSDEAISELTDGLGDLSGALGTASQKTDKLSDSVKSALDVFSEFNDQVGTTGRSVLQNFMNQITGVTKWSKELEALSSRGINANFLVDLADQGPAAYDKIHALYTMTDKELALFNQMYAKKLSLQKDTVKSIRDSFVKNGAMTTKEAAEYGKKITEATANGVESGSDTLSSSMTKTETAAAQSAAEEAKRQKVDDAFISAWSANVCSESSKLVMSQAFTDLGLASMDAFKQSMNFEAILDQLILFKNGIKEQVRSSLKLFDEVAYKTKDQKKAEEYSTQQMLYNMAENTKKIGRWATNIQRLSERGLSEGLVDQLRQLGPEGAEQIDAFVRMSDKELKKANAIYSSSLKLDEYTSDKITSAYSKAGFATALGLKKGLNDGKDDLLFAYQEVGEDASEGFVNGVDPTAANEVMTFLGENSLSALKTALDSHSPSKETEKIGMDTTEGYILGITSPSRLAEAMSNLATTTLGMFSQMLGPDKFRIMGLECIDGFARGLIEGLQTKTRDILNMFTLSMFGINDNLEDPDNSLRVNIIPVVDQNALDGTSALMNDYFGNKRFDISASVNRANAANKTNNPDSDKNLIVEAIRGLREDIRNIKNVNEGYRTDIGSLRDAITSMKVTLDTGALVGQITNPLDAALGTKAMRSLRRRG